MGVIPGRDIEILRKAPIGGPYFIRVADLYFAIREIEAKAIIVE